MKSILSIFSSNEKKEEVVTNSDITNEMLDAAARGDTNWVRRCLAEGADIDAKGATGHTALHYATSNNDVPIIRLLLENAAKLTIKNSDGKIPLDLAIKGTTSQQLLQEASLKSTNDSTSTLSSEKPVNSGNNKNSYAQSKQSIFTSDDPSKRDYLDELAADAAAKLAFAKEIGKLTEDPNKNFPQMPRKGR